MQGGEERGPGFIGGEEVAWRRGRRGGGGVRVGDGGGGRGRAGLPPESGTARVRGMGRLGRGLANWADPVGPRKIFFS